MLDKGLYEFTHKSFERFFSSSAKLHRFNQTGIVPQYHSFFVFGFLLLILSIHLEYSFIEDLLIFYPISLSVMKTLNYLERKKLLEQKREERRRIRRNLEHA